MGRLVSASIVAPADANQASVQFSPQSIHALNLDTKDTEKPPSKTGDDNYAERIAKYVPAEVIAFFLAADKLFPEPDKKISSECATSSTLDCWIAGHAITVAAVVFAIGLSATPLYIWQQRTEGEPWFVHAVMATVAFVVWSYAIRAHVFVDAVFSGAAAGFLVLLYSLLSGFVVPVKKIKPTES